MPLPRHARLHIFTLSSFAIAQPLYDLIGRHAEFLVAHGAGPWTIAALIGLLSLAIPAILVAIVEIARVAGPRPAGWLHLCLVGVLAGLVAAGALKQTSAVVAVPLAVLAAAAGAIAYRAPGVRTFLTVVSPAVLIFPLVFVFATPVSRLVRPERTQQVDAAVRRRPPIVFVLFDELDTLTMLDRNGAIDAGRFPNFAGLTRSATWFPNAVAAFPYTRFAVPAMTTGVSADASLSRLPIAADYPNNLFTWLGTSYALHVEEPISALCPETLCDRSAGRARVDARALMSDVAVLYLHLVAPRDVAEAKLPPLAFLWKGFAAAPARDPAPPTTDAGDFKPAFDRAMELGRSELFRQFIREIAPASKPTLHFAHTLLPHDPYEYLPSGSRYRHGGLTTGMSSEGIWTREPALIETGRKRHAAQARFVDTLVGELVAHLKAQGLFDPALLIVTSDHGAAFRAGDSHRGLTTTNYRELVPAPMFVKLPYQQNGNTSDRRVSGLDIVPTIAAALGSEVPWRADGRPMFAQDFPERPLLEFAGTALPPMRAFDVREEARKTASGRFAEDEHLVGARLDALDVQPNAAGMRVFSDSFRAFQAVSLESGLLPALVQGRVERDAGGSDPVRLAVAVNGAVQAVTRTTPWYGNPHHFAVLVPESAFRDGANRLDILSVDTAAGRARLARLSSELSAGLFVRGDSLVTSEGRQIPIESHIVGVVDHVAEHAGAVSLRGWAADRRSGRALRSVIVFAGGSAVAATAPAAPRADVAAALSIPPETRVVYAVDVSIADLQGGTVRLFAISADNVAGRLELSAAAQEVLARHRASGR